MTKITSTTKHSDSENEDIREADVKKQDKKSEAIIKSGKDSKKINAKDKKAKKSKAVVTEKKTHNPFVLFGRYLRDSWRELRQVHWPNRKTSWKLFFAIVIYTAIFVTLIMLLDALFNLIFSKIL